jgi:hypothetical protein
MQAIRKPYGVLVYKEGDGPGGVNTLMAYNPSTDEIFLGFANIFGYFSEVDFLMDEVIGGLSTTTKKPDAAVQWWLCSYHGQTGSYGSVCGSVPMGDYLRGRVSSQYNPITLSLAFRNQVAISLV